MENHNLLMGTSSWISYTWVIFYSYIKEPEGQRHIPTYLGSWCPIWNGNFVKSFVYMATGQDQLSHPFSGWTFNNFFLGFRRILGFWWLWPIAHAREVGDMIRVGFRRPSAQLQNVRCTNCFRVWSRSLAKWDPVVDPKAAVVVGGLLQAW